MTIRCFLKTALILLLSLGCVNLSRAEGPAASEKAKIEGLISHVEELKSAAFIRNGKEYEAWHAAKFLRAKWNSNRKEIHSASDFIEKAATKSSTTGKPYLIRLENGKTVPCASYLSGVLKKL